MQRKQRLLTFIFIVAFVASTGLAQEPKKPNRQPSPIAKTPDKPVFGGGTIGALTKWISVDTPNIYLLGDANIFEDSSGKVGIGTTTPTSQLTVQGMIETTLGGYKFPDGSLQTTAGIAAVLHDASLTGNGASLP